MHKHHPTEEDEHLEDRGYIKRFIEQSVLIRKSSEQVIMSPKGTESGWFFDFRIAFSEKDFLLKVSNLFWDHFDRNKSWQIGGLESASLPLITTLVLSGTQTTGFYIRKSRKKKMQMRLIEGRVTDKDIILVDDLINTGSSFLKQLAALKNEGRRVSAIFTILRFREESFYNFLKQENIKLVTLFSLNDFGLSMDEEWQNVFPQKPRWYFAPKEAHFFEQGPKNIPVLTDQHIFMTADNGFLFKISLSDGEVVSQKRLVFRKKKSRSTFHSTHLMSDYLYVATYRGALLSVSTSTDRVTLLGSLAQEFVTPIRQSGPYLTAGCSHGVGHNKHFVLFYDPTTKNSLGVPVGGNLLPHIAIYENYVFLSDRRRIYALENTGRVCWEKEWQSDISGTCVIDDKLLIIAMNGSSSFLDPAKGRILESFDLPAFHFDTPVFEDGFIFGATLDREIYCFDLATKKIEWSFETRGRMYSRPTLHQKKLYAGDTNGNVHVIDAKTGLRIGGYVTAERITNPILVTNENVIVTTFANELYVFENILDGQLPEAYEQNHRARGHDSNSRV